MIFRRWQQIRWQLMKKNRHSWNIVAIELAYQLGAHSSMLMLCISLHCCAKSWIIWNSFIFKFKIITNGCEINLYTYTHTLISWCWWQHIAILARLIRSHTWWGTKLGWWSDAESILTKHKTNNSKITKTKT